MQRRTEMFRKGREWRQVALLPEPDGDIHAAIEGVRSINLALDVDTLDAELGREDLLRQLYWKDYKRLTHELKYLFTEKP